MPGTTASHPPASAPHPLSARPTYTDSQLSAYLSLLPSQPPLTLPATQKLISDSPIAALRKLHLLQLAFAPFGSIAMHYSPHRIVSIDPDYLYHKIVHRRQGGYCMELNCFWSTVLRSLGFDVYIAGARVSKAEMGSQGSHGFGGYGHQVTIVRIEGEKWLSDVGFGGRMSLEPVKLEVGARGKGMLGWWQRLAYRGVADFTQGDHKVWVVDVHDEWAGEVVQREEVFEGVQAEEGWRPAYCFADAEWLPADFEMLNYRMCRDSFFTRTLILTRPILNQQGTECVGQLTLMSDELSRTMSGEGQNEEKEVLGKFSKEQDRVEALEKWFSIKLTPDEARGIRGASSEIRG
ncbi:N-hydroxyarylamine O-acetyltransferase [Cyphellophora attinorum]|uniref:N-hydroxyarylamine O-acetyltransferase n=1 Tax=Cyphellophora attinorum TaxID=1664694 RepID=A0A0N0NMJ1_9EURO|nr:N-hydroxyarylamine O-acetyltransferase [Phialophora attinorum]KPI40521.1 N-hydroxyarylamine O-acetyltransferase [Phialophora attinorum]